MVVPVTKKKKNIQGRISLVVRDALPSITTTPGAQLATTTTILYKVASGGVCARRDGQIGLIRNEMIGEVCLIT